MYKQTKEYTQEVESVFSKTTNGQWEEGLPEPLSFGQQKLSSRTPVSWGETDL